MPTTTLIIPGPPIPNKRPRFRRFGSPYDVQYKIKNEIREILRSQFNHEIIEGPVQINWGFYMPIPKYLQRKVKPGDPHTKKPDFDNLIIVDLNCMSNVIFKDDSQVYTGSYFKIYDDNPRTEIDVIWEEFNQGKSLIRGLPSKPFSKKVLRERNHHIGNVSVNVDLLG